MILQSVELEVEVSIWSMHYKLMGKLSDILCCITQLITVLSSQKVRIARLNSKRKFELGFGIGID